MLGHILLLFFVEMFFVGAGRGLSPRGTHIMFARLQRTDVMVGCAVIPSLSYLVIQQRAS